MRYLLCLLGLALVLMGLGSFPIPGLFWIGLATIVAGLIWAYISRTRERTTNLTKRLDYLEEQHMARGS